MSEAIAAPDTARIQIELGTAGGGRVHRLLINGEDVGLQVRSVKFEVDGPEPADVQVTYAHPYVTVEGDAVVSEATNG